MSTTEKLNAIHKANEVCAWLQDVWERALKMEIENASKKNNISIVMAELREKVEEAERVILDNVKNLPGQL